MTKSFIACLLLLFSLNSFCQNAKKRRSIKPDVASHFDADSLIKTINPDYWNATADFSGGTLSKDIITNISGANLFEIEKKADSLNTGRGAFILFYDIRSMDGRKDTVKQQYDSFSWSTDSLRKEITYYDKVNEIKHLMSLKFISGVVYFSGWDFPNVETASESSANLVPFYFARTGPGSIIVFENAVFQNKDGTLLKPLNKTIKLIYN